VKKIRIDKPCFENWDAMTPTAQGKRCAKCTKNVVNACTLSDESIIKMYEENNQSLCIRIPEYRLAKPKRGYLKYALLTSLVLWFSGIKNKLFAQINDAKPIHQDSIKTIGKLTISGTVKDTVATDSPIAYATVIFSLNGIRIGGCYSDKFGVFEMEITREINITDTLVMTVKYLDYTDLVKTINLQSDRLKCDVYFEDNHICINQDVILTSSGQAMLGAIRVGMMIPNKKIITEPGTTTFKSEEIERFNLGR